MTREKLNSVMKQYCIVPSELDDVFAFVADLLYLRREELEQHEPYAYRSIDSLRNAENEVNDLLDYISDIKEEE